jgi:hypothetical protein
MPPYHSISSSTRMIHDLELSTVLLVYQNISVPSLTLVLADNSLIDLIKRVLLDPRPDFVVANELEHLSDGCGRSNS